MGARLGLWLGDCAGELPLGLRCLDRDLSGVFSAGENGENSGAGGKTGVMIDVKGAGEAGRAVGECGGGVMARGEG
jgi:hypothetical protein